MDRDVPLATCDNCGKEWKTRLTREEWQDLHSIPLEATRVPARHAWRASDIGDVCLKCHRMLGEVAEDSACPHAG
jgi:hypothetical protein